VTDDLRRFGLLVIRVVKDDATLFFLFLRKDNGHPLPEYHWKLSLPGGALLGLAASQALRTRLAQQYASRDLVRLLMRRAKPVVLDREMHDTKGPHLMTVFVADITLEEFGRYRRAAMTPKQGEAALLTPRELRLLLSDEASWLPDVPDLLVESLEEKLNA